MLFSFRDCSVSIVNGYQLNIFFIVSFLVAWLIFFFIHQFWTPLSCCLLSLFNFGHQYFCDALRLTLCSLMKLCWKSFHYYVIAQLAGCLNWERSQNCYLSQKSDVSLCILALLVLAGDFSWVDSQSLMLS